MHTAPLEVLFRRKLEGTLVISKFYHSKYVAVLRYNPSHTHTYTHTHTHTHTHIYIYIYSCCFEIVDVFLFLMGSKINFGADDEPAVIAVELCFKYDPGTSSVLFKGSSTLSFFYEQVALFGIVSPSGASLQESHLYQTQLIIFLMTCTDMWLTFLICYHWLTSIYS